MSVARATPADRTRVVADLAAAFAEDPVMSWAFPDPGARRRCAPRFFAMQALRCLPCVESSNPRNVPLNERHGFVVTDEVRLPRGPVVALMRRAVRS